MRFIITSALLTCALILFILQAFGDKPIEFQQLSLPESQEPDVLGAPESVQGNFLDIDLKEGKFRVVWELIENPETIFLYSNLENFSSSKKLFAENSCNLLTSAGFYTNQNLPVGYFLTNGKKVSDEKENVLFDGIFSINYFDIPRITRGVPRDNLRLAVQAGPILIENNFVQDLLIRNDKKARRVIAAVTGTNEVVFLIIFENNSVFSGPYLKDLPMILDNFRRESEIQIADAINLDGGKASAFITDGYELSEISPIGSFFCVK